MAGQYLTAVFELRPSRRKAAIMERARAASEAVFWRLLAPLKARADGIAAIEDKTTRRAAWRVADAEIAHAVTTGANVAALAEPVSHGLARDVSMAVSSYIELRASGHEAQWPEQKITLDGERAAALDLLAASSSKDGEDLARDELARLAHLPGPRPITIARARDATLIRKQAAGSIVVALNILRATDRATRPVAMAAGVDASTGELLKATRTATRILVPVSCSKWHEQKFLAGAATLRSSLIVRRGERWFMCAQFEMREATRQAATGARLGVDRGIVNPMAAAAVRADGAVIAAPAPVSSAIGAIIEKAEQRRRAEQKRRGATSRTHVRAVDNALHLIANQVVADAKQFGATVVFEKLDGLKRTIVTKREAGARKGGWRKALKAAQLAKLEAIVSYKLRLAGLPAAREVVAGGTSITCPACATREPKNRQTQADFRCVACGFAGPADTVAAVNIGRRDVAMKAIRKGDKLAPLEQNMVARLRLRGDSGLGPLLGDYVSGSGFVRVRASSTPANEELSRSPTGDEGQNASHADQNGQPAVLAERVGAFPRSHSQGKTVHVQRDLFDGFG